MFALKQLGKSALVILALGAGAGDASAAECITSDGKTACGYHCVSAEGQVRCSQTPEGVCSVSSGIVACWDPPAVLRRVFPQGVPTATCVTTYGQMACGYVCDTTSDRALCSQTPFGACGEVEGRIACWDPPAAVVLAKQKKTPIPTCLVDSGKIACGYGCVAHDGVVRCAETPDGGCRVEQGKIICWDPPLDSFATTYDPATELACLDATDGRLCGYRCIATMAHSACGAGRADSCRTQADRLVCEPPR